MYKTIKPKLSIIVFIIIVLGLSYNAFIKRFIPVFKMVSTNKVVIIDPGHGNIDKGAFHSESGVHESPINLAVALQLKEALQKQKHDVVLTRDKDTVELQGNAKELKRRIDLAKEHNADILVSIHVNQFPDPQYFGAQCFYNPQVPESKLLALLVQEELKTIDSENFREALPQDLFILRESAVPSILVEMGFLSNPQDREKLQDPTYQKKIASAIGEGIKRYFANDTPKLTPLYD